MKSLFSAVAVLGMFVGSLAFATDRQRVVVERVVVPHVQKQVVVERVVVPQKVVEFVEVPDYFVQQEKVVVRQFVKQNVVVERQVDHHRNNVVVQRNVQRNVQRRGLFRR